MKILFYIQSLSSGGAERVTVTLANYWAGKGWDVVIATAAKEDKDFYELDPRIERMALDMAIESRNAGQAVLNNLRRFWALYRALREDRPAVAVAMMTTANAILALAGRFARVPTVGSERTYPPAMPLGSPWEWIRRQTYPLLNSLVAQTEDCADWIKKHAPAKMTLVIPNPVCYPLNAHEPRVAPEDVLGTLHGEFILLAVGRLGEEKRFDRLLAAFAVVGRKHADWSLVILGEGSLHGTLTRQAADLGVGDRVALPGAVGNVGEWFEAADLYALTSRFEGFPNTLLEALACGVPAVAVDCETGPRDILRHEVDGLLVPQDNPDALIAALDRIMGDADLRARFSKRAVEARERFAVERIAGQWEKLFKECIDGKR